VPVASILSEITDLLTTVVGDYGLYAVFGLMLVEAGIGLALYLMGGRPGQEVHLIYGLGTVLSIPFFIFVETTAKKRPAMGSYIWAFALLAGILIRSMGTGPRM